MKHIKKTLAIIMTAVMLVCMLPMTAFAEAQWTKLGNSYVSYYLDDEGTLTLRGLGPTPDYSAVNRSPFDYSYENDLDIKKVVVEKGVTRLGHMLFPGCPMEEISLPSTLTSIGNYALISCDYLSELDLPANVSDFGLQPFGSCDSLRKITFHSNSVTSPFLYFPQTQLSQGMLDGLRNATICIPLPFTIKETERNNKTTVIMSNKQAQEILIFDEEYENTVQCLNDCSCITFNNYDGTVLSQAGIPVGETPSFNGETPQRNADASNHYTFSGWSDGESTYAPDSLPACVKDKDVTYTAEYTAQAHSLSPSWSWAEDKSSASVTFACTADGCGYSETAEAVITREIRADKVVSTATAVFGGETYTNEITEDRNGGVLIDFASSEYGTGSSDKYLAQNGDTVSITFTPADGYDLYSYRYGTYDPQGNVIDSGTTDFTNMNSSHTYDYNVNFSNEDGGRVVFTPDYRRVKNITDATESLLEFHRTYSGASVTTGFIGENVFVFPKNYIGSGDEGCKIESITVTDENGNPVETELSSYGWAQFTMPDSNVTVNATVSGVKYSVNQEYDPIHDHGVIHHISSDALLAGETYQGQVESFYPYVLTGLYAKDANNNVVDLIANGSYDAQTGIVSFTMPAKSLTLYFTHELNPNLHSINLDAQSQSAAENRGSITRIGASYMGAVTGEEVTLKASIPTSYYALTELYYIDGDGVKTDLMSSYNKADGTFTITMPDSDITLYYTFDITCRIVMGEAEHGTVTCDKEYSLIGDKINLSFHPDEGYTLSEYKYEYFSADGTSQRSSSNYTYYYDNTEYEESVADFGGEGGYLVITPVFVNTYNIIDNTGALLHFHRASIGDSTHKGIPGMTIYVYPYEYINDSGRNGVGRVIESITVTDSNGQELEVELHGDARFIMPESDVTVNAVVSGLKYYVIADYDPIRDHGCITAQSEMILSEGETYVGKVESFYPYILTGLYSEDNDGNRTDLIANGSYNAETGIVSFTMPAKPLTLYREHVINPEYHHIIRDEQSYQDAKGYIIRNGYNELGGITGEEITLNVDISDAYPNYELSSLYYIDENSVRVNLMPYYDRANHTVTFTMPDSDLTLYYSFSELRTVTINDYGNDVTVSGFAGDTAEFVIVIDDYAQEHAKLDATYFYYYDSNNEYQELAVDWNKETGKGTFVMPDEDITLHIHYAYYRDVPVKTFEHGAVTADKETAIDGETITYTVHPEDGWIVTALGQRMSQYSVTGVQDETDENIWYVMMPWGWSGDRVLWATFEEDPSWHTITFNDCVNGSVSYENGGAKAGKTVNLVVTPNEGYQLDTLTVSDQNGTEYEVNGTSFVMPDVPVTVSATFKTAEHTVSWVVGGETVETDVNVPYGSTPEYNGEMPENYSTSSSHYVFAGWNDGTRVYSVAELPAVTNDVTYTAAYTQEEHNYGEPEWTWAENHGSASAEFTCTLCGHKETVNADVTSEVDGDKRVYTATVNLNGHTYTDSASEELINNGVSITVANELSVNFYLDGDYGENAFVKLTYNHNTDISETADICSDVVSLASLDTYTKQGSPYDGSKIFTVKQAPAQITEDVLVEVFANQADADSGENILYTQTYNVAAYCNSIISANSDEKLTALASSVLNYAAASQVYFGYNTGHMAADVNTQGITPAGVAIQYPSGLLNGLSMVATSAPRFKLFTSAEAAVNDINGVDGAQAAARVNGDRSFIEISGIAPAYFGNTFTVATASGDVSASVNSLLALMAERGDAKAADLAKTMYAYGECAEAYFQ